MITAAIAAALAAPPPAPPPLKPEAQVEAVVRCRVLDRDGGVKALHFRKTWVDGSPAFIVEADETGLLQASDRLYDNVTWERFSGKWRDARLARFAADGQSLVAARFFPDRDGRATIVLERQTQPLMDAAAEFAFAGVCKSIERPRDATPSKDRTR